MKHILHQLLTLILLAGLTSCAAEGDINDGFYYPNFNEGAPSDTQENLGGDQFTDYGENDFIATATKCESEIVFAQDEWCVTERTENVASTHSTLTSPNGKSNTGKRVPRHKARQGV